VTDYTPTTWAQALLRLIGVPVNQGNTSAVVAWEAAEGGNWHNSDKYNPLNTTQSAPGAVSTNSAGVKAYTSWDQGLQATATTLQNGLYGSILGALKSGTPQDVVNAVVGSPWGTKSISLAGSTYTGGGGAGAGGSSATATPALSLSDPLGVGSLETSLRKTAISGVFVLAAVGLVVVGLLRGTHAVARTHAAADKAGSAAAAGAEVAA
jgi:hypothetical protein